MKHIKYCKIISDTISDSAKVRGTGIALRTPEYIETKIRNNNAIIAIDGKKFAGFCYIEIWGHGKYVAHSGLIVSPEYRGIGLAKKIKKKTFNYSKEKYPDTKIFGITTGLAVMKINYSLGYEPVTFSELTDDKEFWKGCQSCPNYDILQRNERKNCLCTGMLLDPSKKKKTAENEESSSMISKGLSKLKSLKNKLKNK